MLNRFVVLLLLCVAYSHGAIDDKIAKTKSQMHTKKVQEKEVSRKLSQLAKEITQQDKKLAQIKKDISSSEAKIKQLKTSLNLKSGKLKKLETLYNKLKKKENEVNKKLSSLLSQEIALSMISGESDDNRVQNAFEQNSEQLVFKEVLKRYRKLLREKFLKTKTRFEKLQKNRVLIQTELQKTRDKLAKLEKEQKRLTHLQNLQSETVRNLRSKKKRYTQKLLRIRKEKKSLAKTLNKLHITRKKLEQTRIKPTKTDNINVRQIGSSYQKGTIAKYKGKKTIAPLKKYTIVQKFGTFVDPIYKIKIFNESVTLKPKSPNAVVRNILPGKVVYASKIPMLDYVVIVEHPGKLHTIYAHLNKIAPTIKVGKKVKKAYALGRVNNTLTFEVTQQEKHINPMELIR
jgi:murein DD-endopeptidase MepM/ murein hydrolase activator NlpD